MEKFQKYKSPSLEDIVDNVKKLPKSSSLKLSVNSMTDDPSSGQNSPSGRSAASSFQQSHTSITQNLKAKTMKSPTPIMPGGHKRPGEFDHNGWFLFEIFNTRIFIRTVFSV